MWGTINIQAITREHREAVANLKGSGRQSYRIADDRTVVLSDLG